MISPASETRCSRATATPSGPGGKPRHCCPIERAKAGPAERHTVRHERADVTRAAVQVEAKQGAALHLVASTRQERMPAFHVAVDQMLEPDGDLNQPLERDAVAPLGPEPIRFQQLVHLEIEAGVE